MVPLCTILQEIVLERRNRTVPTTPELWKSTPQEEACFCGEMVNTPAFDAKDPGSSPTDTIGIMTHLTPSGEWNCVIAASRYRLISSYGRSRTYRVASLRAWPVGRISYNMLFDCNMGGMYITLRRRKINYRWRGPPDSSVSSLIPTGWCGRASHHQKLAPTFPGIDSCLMVTKWDFLEMEASLAYD